MTIRRPPEPRHAAEHPEEIPERLIARGYVRLDREGRWWIDDGPVRHPKLVAFLWRHLVRNLDGDYWIVNGPQRVIVEAEDTPFVVRHVFADGDRLMLEFADSNIEPLPDDGLLQRDDDTLLVVGVRRGRHGDVEGDGHSARLSRAAVADLARFLETDERGTVRLVCGQNVWPVQPASDRQAGSQPSSVRPTSSH